MSFSVSRSSPGVLRLGVRASIAGPGGSRRGRAGQNGVGQDPAPAHRSGTDSSGELPLSLAVALVKHQRQAEGPRQLEEGRDHCIISRLTACYFIAFLTIVTIPIMLPIHTAWYIITANRVDRSHLSME